MLGINEDFDFENAIKIPDWIGEGLYRCRISYAEKIDKIEFFPYQFKHPKIIQLNEYKSIRYGFKYKDRSEFQDLLKNYPNVDDVIITQDGFLTDATYANLAFSDGKKWFTPSTYLLEGTKRAYLLDNKLLTEDVISVSDLSKFKQIALINAMRDLEIYYNFEVFKDKILIK